MCRHISSNSHNVWHIYWSNSVWNIFSYEKCIVLCLKTFRWILIPVYQLFCDCVSLEVHSSLYGEWRCSPPRDPGRRLSVAQGSQDHMKCELQRCFPLCRQDAKCGVRFVFALKGPHSSKTCRFFMNSEAFLNNGKKKPSAWIEMQYSYSDTSFNVGFLLSSQLWYIL